MCWGTTSRSRFLSKSCTGKFRFDLFLSDPVIFKLQAEPLQPMCNIPSKFNARLFGASVQESSVVLWKRKPLTILFSLFIEWSCFVFHPACSAGDQQPNRSAVAHTLVSITFWPQTDKLSLLPAERCFSPRAWQHLYSLCTSFLPQLTESRVITGLSLVITDISAYASGHTHTCIHNVPSSQTDKMAPSKNIRLLIVTLVRCKKRSSESRRVQSCFGRFSWVSRRLVRKMTVHKTRLAVDFFPASGWCEAGAERLMIMHACYWALYPSL